MRTALRYFARLPVTSHAITNSLLSTALASSARLSIQNGAFIPCTLADRRCCRSATTAARPRRKPKSRLLKDALRGGGLRVADPKDPRSFVGLYDAFLPVPLKVGNRGSLDTPPIPSDVNKILAIYEYAQNTGRIDLWPWMAQNGYKKQLVWLINAALKDITGSRKLPNSSMPSNIDWPATIFDDLHYGKATMPEVSKSQWRLESPSLDSSTTDRPMNHPVARQFMTAVWLTLAKLVLAVNEPESGQASSCMNPVMLILATLHNLGMIPANVYAYKALSLSSTVKRPPILHLVYSRILTSLSDATWREQQDDAIAQASQLGHSLQHISQNVPGGRFRLKVKPLPAEIWLELILWCCIDGGLQLTAHEIITLLHQSEDPWFAVRWCSTHTSPLAETLVDWNRVKLRHGGTVGLIEGYSREKPFVDVPPKTVSVEVVLALIEAFATDNSARKLIKISDLIRFLEPHDLPPSYFDYLESRLISAGTFDDPVDPTRAQEWSAEVRSLRALKPIKDVPRAAQTLELDSILDHGLLRLGIMHQSLDALISDSAVHNALQLFNDIQEEVDRNKIQSISEFLQVPFQTQVSTFTANQDHPYRLEYADSHGQIAHYQLAPFLDLATDAKMLGLGEWLLYSDDLDDALIPSSTYTATSLAPSLSRYASAGQDVALYARIVGKFDASMELRPSVRTCRAFFDAGVELLDLTTVVRWLLELRKRGARIGLSNYAYLGATILRIEHSMASSSRDNSKSQGQIKLRQATSLLEAMLSGQYHTSVSSETLAQRVTYRQQISHILRIFAQCRHSELQSLARKYAQQYAGGNNVMLPTRVFDVILSGIVDVYGATRGKEVYEDFCKTPHFPNHYLWSDSHHFESDMEDTGAETGLESNNIDDLESAGDPYQPEKSPAFQLITNTGHTASEEEFPNAYFPLLTGDEQLSDKRSTSQDSFVDPVIRSDRFLRPLPVATPQASTLRVIVQAVLAQTDMESDLRGAVTAWAAEQFLLLGTQSFNVIAQEIQRPLTEVDIQGMKSRLKYKLVDVSYRQASEHPTFEAARRRVLAQKHQEQQAVGDVKSLWAEMIPSWRD